MKDMHVATTGKLRVNFFLSSNGIADQPNSKIFRIIRDLLQKLELCCFSASYPGIRGRVEPTPIPRDAPVIT